MKTTIQRTLLATALTLSLAATGGVFAETQADNKATYKLAKVELEGFDHASIAPETNFKQFTKIMFAPLDFSDMEVVEPKLPEGRTSRWRFTKSDQKEMEKRYRNAITKAFADSETLQLVEEPGPNVVVVKPKIVNFEPTGPKYNSRDSSRNFLGKYSAEIDLNTTLIDGANDSVIANFVEERVMGDNLEYERLNRARFNSDMTTGFISWALNFRYQFDVLDKVEI